MNANFDNILKYQKFDIEKHKILNEVEKSPYLKKQEQARECFGKEKQTMVDCESNAAKILAKADIKAFCHDAYDEFEKLNSQLETNTNIEQLSASIEKLGSYKNKLVDAERKLLDYKTHGDKLIDEYKNAQERGKKMRDIYANNKMKQDELKNSKQEQLNTIDASMHALRIQGDKVQYERYDKLAGQNILPAYVSLINDTNCGGCGMAVAGKELANLKNNGVCFCETCKRIIYLESK